MGLILVGIKFGEIWRNSPNLIPAKIKKDDHSPNKILAKFNIIFRSPSLKKIQFFLGDPKFIKNL